MWIVVDTSAIVAVLLKEGERTQVIRATLGAEVVVPASVSWEVGNALVVAYRRGRIDERGMEAAWSDFLRIPLRPVDVPMEAALRIAAKARIYAYDAYILAAAVKLNAPLLTLDRRLRGVAVDVGIEIVEVTS